MNKTPKNIFITGASSGIGEALAVEYAKLGENLILLARRMSHLENVKKRCLEINRTITVDLIECDVTNLEQMKSQIKHTLSSEKIDIVIANAGVGIAGYFTKLNLDHFRNVMEINVFGVLNTLTACIEYLNPKNSNFCIIGSVNSYLSLPGKSPYCMSKSAIKSFADSLYYELKPKNISVTLICPGLVESEIRQKNNEGKLNTNTKDPAPKFLTMSSKKAAKKILVAIKNNKKEVVITFHGKVLVWLERHLPILIAPLKKGFVGKFQ